MIIYILFITSVELTSLWGKCCVSINPFPNAMGINKKHVIRKTHPDTTPKASGLQDWNIG